MIDRQSRYELFLDGVQKREDAAILACLPKTLVDMTARIKEAGEIIKAQITPEAPLSNWEAKSLPRLRELYKQVSKPTSPHTGLKALEEMATQINSWSRRLPFCVAIMRETVNDSRSGFDSKAQRIAKIHVVRKDKNA